MTSNGVIEFLTIEDLLLSSGIKWNPYEEGDWEYCQSILTKLSSMRMVEIDSKSSKITILNWTKRQEQFATNAERQAKHRDKAKSNAKVTEHVTKVTLEENRREENILSEAKASQGYTVLEGSEDKPVKVSKAQYPHSKEVFSLFPNPQKSWEINVTERKHAELLYARGRDQVVSALDFITDHKGDPMCPQVLKPSDLERKWLQLFAYRKRS